MELTTESSSNHDDLHEKSTRELLEAISSEDKTVPLAVEKELASIQQAVELIHAKMKDGGRLFYIGSGTSGRLGIVDASECPPTYGVPHGWVIGIIAGGDTAIRKAVENAEDDTSQGIKDLDEHKINSGDVVVGISASGKTPYVKGALEACRSREISTIAIACNKKSQIGEVSDIAIEVLVGPEVVTGSTRMKSGTAQKLVLNMLTTSVMIKLGKVVGNKMVDMQLSNAKLIERGTRMIMEESGVDSEKARAILLKTGSVRNALKHIKENEG